MPNKEFKKNYSFRLTQDDLLLYSYLENYAGNKSERIREMLTFALENMIHQSGNNHSTLDEKAPSENDFKLEGEVDSDVNKLILERLFHLEELLEKYHEEVKANDREDQPGVQQRETNEGSISNKSVESTNDSLFGAWGIEF